MRTALARRWGRLALAPLAAVALFVGLIGWSCRGFDSKAPAPRQTEPVGGADRSEEAERAAADADWGGDGSVAAPEPAPAPPPGIAVAGLEAPTSREALPASTSSAPGATTGGAAGAAAAGPAVAEPAKPMVIYQGYLKLRVRHLRQAVDAAVSMAEKAGGYVESLGRQVVIVRVPATDFERVMDLFATLGQVLARRTEAYDVTARYRDTLLRLQVAEAAKERLLALLERTTDPGERLRIIREVKRLSEEIETMSSTLATLKNLSDFFTITLELEPVTASNAPQGRSSPFPWVRGLTPHRATIGPFVRDHAFDAPRGFVVFERERAFRAQAADTTTLRLGGVRNDPRGDSAFWARAVDHEMTARDELRVEEGSAGRLAYRVYRDKDLAPRYYLVALHATDDRVYVVEAFFPNEEAWQQHREAVLQALASFEERT